MKKSYEKCPYCNEKILLKAKKCRYCGEWLDENLKPQKKSHKSLLFLIPCFIALLLILILLYNNSASGSATNINSSPNKVNNTSSPAPTQRPNVPTNTTGTSNKPTPVPKTNKVPLTFNFSDFTGTYYCLETNANQISNLGENLRFAHKSHEICWSGTKADIEFCYSRCDRDDTPDCSSCPTGKECDNHIEKVENAREELRNAVFEYCN